jgi:dihydrofolate reductase
LWGATTGVGIAVGPIVGGWLLERFSWSSVFFALAPIAALGAVLVMASVPTSRDPQAAPADRAGLALSTAAMALLIYTIIEAPNHGWAAARSVGGFALALALLGAFVTWERRARAPMLDVGLFRDLRFSAASGAVTITFFSLMGFIFLVTLYFQFLKGYGPFSTGVRLLPVATMVGITSVAGTRLAVRSGTKLVVAGGLVALAGGLAWTSSASASTSYLTIVGQMVLIGSGIGLTSAPATESIMGAVPAAKAGVGSAINDATRILGATLGVAVIGSIYASLYSSRLDSALSGRLPPTAAAVAHRSVGGAFETAVKLAARHQTTLAGKLHDAASNAFFNGFSEACVVAAGVALTGAVMAAVLIPAQPPQPGADIVGAKPRSAGGAPSLTARKRCHERGCTPAPSRKGSRMRSIVWSEYISLDGVVEEPGEWSIPYFSDDLAQYKSDELFESDALLLGRSTYEAFAAAWPNMEDVEGDFAVRMNTLPKYIASTTLKKAEWNNSTVIRDNIPEEVSKLKQEPGKNILIAGSGALAKSLMRHNLIDEIRMLVHPVAVGSGKRLFEGAKESIGLKLVDMRPFESGVVALTYQAGALIAPRAS